MKEERKRKLESERRDLELRVVREAVKQREQVAKRQKHYKNAHVKAEMVPHGASGGGPSQKQANTDKKVKVRVPQGHEVQPNSGTA